MAQNQVEELLNARAEIDEQLRRHKNLLTVLFTDVVGSTSYFDRFGDTAGLAMVHLNAELGTTAVREFGGTVVKTIGDSVMADFPNPKSAVSAAIAMQRRLAELNSALPEHRRMQIRIGIHSGMGFRKGTDVFGDVVNLAARITKRTQAGQILISKAVQEAAAVDSNINCQWLDKCTLDGRAEHEDIFEVVWTDLPTYTELRRNLQKAHSDSRVEAPLAPKLPSRYEVLDKVGQGGVGIVYKARDLQTNEILALKVLKPEAASDATAQANFSKELSLARKITHKNVCRIYDLYRNDGVAYASMEYVEGENLLSILSREGKMPVDRALGILRQLCGGLGEAHAQGVVHRDLKPANIMVDGSGTVKIMDFGIARMMETGVGQTATIVGTPAYMSPEQAEGKFVDARSDIYAIGLIFYEMITGRATFSGDTIVAIAMKQVTEAPGSPRDLVPTIPQQIEAVILKCLEKDPSRRFQSVGELATELENNLTRSKFAAVQTNKTAWISERLSQFERYISGTHVGKMVEQEILKLSRPMPKQLRFGSRQIETRHALILATLICLTPVIAWTALGHSKGTPTLTSKSSGSISISKNGQMPRNSTAPPAPYNESSNEKSLPLGDLDSNSALAKSDVDNANDAKIESSDERVRTSPEKPASHSATKSLRTERPAQTAAVLPLPPPSTGLPPATSASLMAPTTDANSGNSLNATNDASVSTHTSTSVDHNTATDSYFDVGSFKDPKWADNASETLENLGFHTISQRKGKLWMNSYHVIVGPFSDDDAVQAARRDLESHGFKPRLTKID